MRSAIAFTVLFISNSAADTVDGIHSCDDYSGTDCSTCTAVEGCYYWPDMQFCEQGCGMNGCGADICSSQLTTCAECLGGPGTSAQGHYAWSPSSGAAGQCVDSCSDPAVPADASCFPASSYDSSICESVSVCRTFTDCSMCLEGGACAWSEGSCYESCMDDDVPADASCFEGKTFTPSEAGCPVDCRGITGCSKCLKQDECAWSSGECFNDCMDAPADAACYPGSDFGKSVCNVEELDVDVDFSAMKVA